MPMAQSGNLHLTEPGPYDLYVQGRRGVMDFRGLLYELTTAAGGRVPMEPVGIRSTTTSMSCRVNLPGSLVYHCGTGRLHPPDHRSSIRRGFRQSARGQPSGSSRMVLHILDLVALGALTIGSLVASVLVVVLPGRTARSRHSGVSPFSR